jgi:hypothetical protein
MLDITEPEAGCLAIKAEVFEGYKKAKKYPKKRGLGSVVVANGSPRATIALTDASSSTDSSTRTISRASVGTSDSHHIALISLSCKNKYKCAE